MMQRAHLDEVLNWCGNIDGVEFFCELTNAWLTVYMEGVNDRIKFR